MIVVQRDQKTQFDNRSSRPCSSGPVSIAGTAYPFPGESHAHAIRLRALSAPPARVGRKTPRLTSNGEMELELDPAGSGGSSQADKRDLIILTIPRLSCDRQPAPQHTPNTTS